MSKVTYKDSGVDLDIYADSMSRLPKLMTKTFSPQVMRLDGGFAGLFQLNSAAKSFRDPVLVSCTDGVGTKLKIAGMVNQHDTVGIDLVAMCVNDAICCGATPILFLDYVAMSKDDPVLLEQIVSGISSACVETGSALIGGETAIMPDLYALGEYDLAGFCVGVAEKSEIIDGKAIRPDDVLIGVASSGCHSNGFSLIRKIVFDVAGLTVNDMVPELGQTVGQALLTPTRLYVKPVLRLLDRFGANRGIHGIAHITGGGLEENLSRILPEGTALQINSGSWQVPPVFAWLQKLGEVDDSEMSRVFNCGIGLVLVADQASAEEITSALVAENLTSWTIGKIIKR
ncbi:MAG: phosphoribosylformylglycinamidine cyclo-ligase [Planctomycetia bacterium]|nr:phosphoribosylformylglycinamidine cyclo-ligase [Planctomycetia bacterium]